MDQTRPGWLLGAALAALVGSLLVHGWAFYLGGPVSLGNWIHPDNLSNHWLLVWVVERLLAGESLLHNDLYYWPVGDAPLLAGNGMAGFTYLPFHLLFGWPYGVLVWSVLALSGNGLAAAWLAKEAGAERGGAWIAAALVSCHPYVVAELDMGHFSQQDMGALLAALAALVRLLRGGGRRWGVVVGALSGVAALLYWYHGVFFALAALVLIPGIGGRKPPLAGLGLAVLTGALLVAPWGVVSLSTLDQVVGMSEIEQFPHPHAVDAVLHPGWPIHVTGSWQWGRALPLLLIPLALSGIRRSSLPWVALWGLGFALSLGPSGPLYEPIYGLAEPLRRFWWPYRHAVLMIAAVAVLAALGWRRSWPSWAAALFALSLPLQLRLAGDLRLAKVSPLSLPPPAYEALAELPDGVVIEPPINPKASGSTSLLIYQLWHKKTLLGGHAQWVNRVRPPEWDAAVAASPFLSTLQAWEVGEAAGELPCGDLPELVARGVRYLVINPEHFHRRLNRTLRGYNAIGRRLAGVPVIRDGDVEVFDLSLYKPGLPVALPENVWPRGFPQSGPEHSFPGEMVPSQVFTSGREQPGQGGPVPQGGIPPE